VLNYTIIKADIAGKVTSVAGGYLPVTGQGLVGSTIAELEARFGKPLAIVSQTSRRCLVYSGTNRDGSYDNRNVGLDKSDRVNNIVARWYQD
jgi:hypothetical protein